MTYNVFGGTLSLAQSVDEVDNFCCCRCADDSHSGAVRMLRVLHSSHVHALNSSQSALLRHQGHHAVFSALIRRHLYIRPSAEPPRETHDQLARF